MGKVIEDGGPQLVRTVHDGGTGSGGRLDREQRPTRRESRGRELARAKAPLLRRFVLTNPLFGMFIIWGAIYSLVL